MLTFLPTKGLIECHFSNPYDEVCDALVLDFIKHGLDEMFFFKVAKSKTSKETWKILEEKFGARGSNEVEGRSVKEILKMKLKKEL